MSVARSLLNPGHRQLAGFIVVSFVLHLLGFIWYAMLGGAPYAALDSGLMGPGGGGDDIVFQLSRGNSGGPLAEIPGADLDVLEAIPETLTDDQIEAPLVEEEMAVPIAPADDLIEKEKKEKADAAAKAAREGAAKGAVKGRPGGDGGDAEETRRGRAGSALSGPQITASAAGRQLNLLAGRLDVPGGNRLMNVKLNLFPDGMMRVELTYFHYKTFHKLVTSTRHFKGDGKWWVDKDSLCLQSMVIDYGTINCYEMNQTPDGKLDLYFSECTGKSSTACRKHRLGARGEFSSGPD